MSHNVTRTGQRAALLSLLFAFLLGGCAGPSTQENVLSGTPLAISGAPNTSVNAGASYSFQPTVSGASGTPTYSVQNKPTWASFNTTTGALTGAPSTADVGSTANIVISVSDGKDSASLPAFSFTVTQGATGSATVSWTPPIQNTDGSPLTTLEGYRISYGTNAGALDTTIEITNVGLTSYVIDNLSPGTYFFAVKAFTTNGLESDLSNIASKTIG